MSRFLKRLGVRFILYWHIFWIVFPVTLQVKSVYIREFVFPQSYISIIDTPEYSSEWTYEVLNEFNAMGDGKAVNFSKPGRVDRPITIGEKADLEIIPPFLRDPNYTMVTIGRAYVEDYSCKITLKTGLDYATFRTTLIHEYLHCMGYEHVEGDPNDLMAPVDGQVPEENIRQYAKDVAKKIWKNSKN
jgi:hypothetical protein